VVPYKEIQQCIATLGDDPHEDLEKQPQIFSLGRKKKNGPLFCCGAADAISPQEQFEVEWRNALREASLDFDRTMRKFWSKVFGGILSQSQNQHVTRGALPDTALRLFISLAPKSKSQELLALLKITHSTSLTNAEALRKLVKKFDKEADQRGDDHLSPILLPEVYAANFTVGQPTLEAGLALLRTQLGLDDDDDEEEQKYSEMPEDQQFWLEDNDKDESSFWKSRSRADSAADMRLVGKRLLELKWLRELCADLDQDREVGKLVSHRGFHWPSDRSDTRPLENSLQAYEAAWTNGIHLCECDIALTKDEKLVLCHDEDFTRLALDPTSPMAQKKVKDLTLQQLMTIPLKTGSRPPLLIDVLRSAHAIGDTAQLVIEIKPGNPEVSPALARMFIRHRELMEKCAAVISFDAFAMHTLRRELVGVGEIAAQVAATNSRGGSVSIPNSMSLGNVGCLRIDSCILPMTVSNQNVDAELFAPTSNGKVHTHNRMDSTDHFGVGLSISLRRDSFALGNMENTSFRNRQRSFADGDIGLSLGVDARRDSFELSPFKSMNNPAMSTEPNGDGSLLTHLLLENGSVVVPENDVARPLLTRLLSKPKIHENNNHVGTEMNNETTRPLLSRLLSASKIAPIHKTPSGSPTAAAAGTRQNIGIRPKLMLLAVSETPQIPCQLWLDVVGDVSPLDRWLTMEDGSLDGVYLQFQKEMLEPKGSQALQALSEKYKVGVWELVGTDPDDIQTFRHLVNDCGVSYVNSALPKKFKKKPNSPGRW
jgi:hypothetical protein